MHRVIIVFVLLSSVAWAGAIQYDPVTGEVTGASDGPIRPTAGREVIEIPESVSAIQWPIPSGCAAGQALWTQITNPSAVTVSGSGMGVRPDLIIFTTTSTLLTGCHPVPSWSALRRLYRQTIANVVVGASDEEAQMIQVLNDVQLWVMRRCPESVGSANCMTSRANMVTMDSDYRGAGQAADLTTQLVTLRNDVNAFKTAQCAAVPGGPFC